MENELAVLMQLGVDITMIVRRHTMDNLATRGIALLLAERIIALEFGADELARQLPLIVTEDSDCWTIEGSHVPITPNVRDGTGVHGKIEIAIAKIDCQVRKFSREVYLPPPP